MKITKIDILRHNEIEGLFNTKSDNYSKIKKFIDSNNDSKIFLIKAEGKHCYSNLLQVGNSPKHIICTDSKYSMLDKSSQFIKEENKINHFLKKIQAGLSNLISEDLFTLTNTVIGNKEILLNKVEITDEKSLKNIENLSDNSINNLSNIPFSITSENGEVISLGSFENPNIIHEKTEVTLEKVKNVFEMIEKAVEEQSKILQQREREQLATVYIQEVPIENRISLEI